MCASSLSNLPACALSVGHSIQRLRHNLGITAFYLASDVGLDGTPHSATLTDIPKLKNGTEALNTLVAETGPPLTWRDVVPYMETRHIHDDYLLAAMIDRVMLMYADHMATVPMGCSKDNNSSFNQAIVRWRLARRKTVSTAGHKPRAWRPSTARMQNRV